MGRQAGEDSKLARKIKDHGQRSQRIERELKGTLRDSGPVVSSFGGVMIFAAEINYLRTVVASARRLRSAFELCSVLCLPMRLVRRSVIFHEEARPSANARL